MHSNMHLVFLTALFAAALHVRAIEPAYPEKCTTSQEIRQAFIDGSNKPREEDGVHKL
ncbi:hypothetical protein OESDEN_18776, partial [Oesophagostomum dentatum]